MTPLEIASMAAVLGAFVPIALGMVYCFAVDAAKRYADEQIRDAKQDLREYARDQ